VSRHLELGTSPASGRPRGGADWADWAGYDAIAHGLAAIPLAWDVVAVRGPDAQRYLQGQLSQDISGLGAGGWAWSLVLQPQGRLVALVRVHMQSAEEFLLVTDAGVGPALVERLKRFLLRTKAAIEQLPWHSVAVRGPGATVGEPARGPAAESGEAAGRGAGGPGAEAKRDDEAKRDEGSEAKGRQAEGRQAVGSGAGATPAGTVGFAGALGASVAVPFSWGSLAGYDLMGVSPSLPAGAVAASEPEYEAARIEAGFPRHGAELDERTIPAEAGIVEASVSFTKGCYTGQELVARIDSRGSHVPRRLRGLLLEGPAQPGAELLEAAVQDAKVVGRLTSVAWSPRLGWVALAYTGRSVEPGQSLWLRSGERFVAGELRVLPLAP
jgi:folate-binding protein YgfZ